MKKIRVYSFISLLVAVAIVFFPFKTTHIISGRGEVLTREKEKICECMLSIEISEVKSLFACYKKQFTYNLNGKDYTSFATSSYTEADNHLCLISQMYYDEENDTVDLYSLVFPEDLSYAVICSDTNLYFIKNSPNILYEDIPVS